MSFDMIVLGGTGDLALRKLLPALYHLEREGRLSEIVVRYRPVPHLIFDGAKDVVHPNRLVICLRHLGALRVDGPHRT